MKKFLPFLMILMVLFAFVACDNGNGDNPNPDTPPVSDPAGTGGSNSGNGNGGNGGGDGDSSGTGSAGGSDTGGDGDITDNPVQEPEILLPPPVGKDEFAGTTWIYERDYGDKITYEFADDGTVKYTEESIDHSSFTTYYSYDSEKGILSLQIKFIDFFEIGEQLSSFPTSEEMYEMFIKYGGEDELKAELAAMGMTWEEFYESEAMYMKEDFEEEMQYVNYIPYKISDNEATFYRDFYGDNIDMQTYVDMMFSSFYYTKLNENNENQYSIEGRWDDDDDSGYLVLTLYEYDESKAEFLPTEIRTTKIEGNTLTWEGEDGYTSTCTVTWNNTEKRYDFVINYKEDPYSGYKELYYTTYTKQ